MNLQKALQQYTKDSIISSLKKEMKIDMFSEMIINTHIDNMLKAKEEQCKYHYLLSIEMTYDEEEMFSIEIIDKDTQEEKDIKDISYDDLAFTEIDEDSLLILDLKDIICLVLKKKHEYYKYKENVDNDDNIFSIDIDNNDILGAFASILFGGNEDFVNALETLKERTDKELKNCSYIDVGSIELPTGKIIIADPNEFMINEKDNPNIFDVKPGKWYAQKVYLHEEYTHEIILKHEDYKSENIITNPEYNILPSEYIISNKSGMIVIDEINNFRNDEIFNKDYVPEYNFGKQFSKEREKYYGKCCDITLNTEEAAGNISSTGFVADIGQGESEYCKILNEDDEIIGLVISLDYE